MPRGSWIAPVRLSLLAALVAASSPARASVPSDAPSGTLSDGQSDARELAIGDTLTVIMRPVLSVPRIIQPGGSFTIEAKASPSATGWTAWLVRGPNTYGLAVTGAVYQASYERWFLTAAVPADVPDEVYDLGVQATGGVSDTEAHAVAVREDVAGDFYVVHITDPHLPTHLYHYESGADTDTTEMVDLRAVIKDINIMNPAFVLLTGDVVNEGELEDYLNKRYYTRAKRILRELEVPVYVAAGNHDIGGWDDTPPPAGTARRSWWRFFGWRYLYDPPPAETVYTQDHAFDYGGAHFVGLEAYDNYDLWRRTIYGTESFTTRQLAWLSTNLSSVPPTTPVIAFYHMDFDDELNLSSLGIDCALWGHIHSTSGSTTTPPYDLSLEAVCDGGRAMRVVRVSGGATITPSQPIDAGSGGQKLRLLFDVPNDGTHEEMTASIVNAQSQGFEHALIKFRVPAASAPYEAEGGELLQTIVEGDVAVCYVRVNAHASTTTGVSISPSPGSGVPDGGPGGLALARPAWPNPARERASLTYSLASPASARVEILDVAGRLVKLLDDGERPAGEHEVAWDLTDGFGNRVASGVYLSRILSGTASLTQKVVVLR